MMRDAILDFPKQFKYRPKIEGGRLKKYKKFLVCGMGGSAQPAEALRSIMPEIDLSVHKDYGILAGDWKKTLVIAMSYSGNTEETISSLTEAVSRQMPAIAIATGGRLIELAKEKNLPYILIPSTGIQPRCATGFLLLALLKAMKLSDLLKQFRELAKALQPKNFEQKGKELAEKLKNSVPVIYASRRNYPLAYMWKIKFNETGKIPAFYNVFPELNHNEMNGFDIKEISRPLSERFYFIFLKDSQDGDRVQKRMAITGKLFADRGLKVETVGLVGQTRPEKIFSSLILGDWAAYYTAEGYGLESEQVPMVEEFKKLIKDR